MKVISIDKSLAGQTLIVRFLPNAKNLNRSIYPYPISLRNNNSFIRRFLCLAYVNDELSYFDFTETIFSKISNTDVFIGTYKGPLSLFQLNINKGIKIDISIKSKIWLDTAVSIIEDDKFILDHKTPESRKKISDILMHEDVNLRFELLKILSLKHNKYFDLHHELKPGMSWLINYRRPRAFQDVLNEWYPNWESELRDIKINKLIKPQI